MAQQPTQENGYKTSNKDDSDSKIIMILFHGKKDNRSE